MDGMLMSEPVGSETGVDENIRHYNFSRVDANLGEVVDSR